MGFVMLFSNRETLLFYKGLAKRPGDVAPGLRNIPGDLRRRFRDLRSLPLREAIGFRGSSEEVLPKKEDSDWMREGLREGIKASAVLIFFGFTSGLIGATTQSLRDSSSTATALFQLTSFVFA
ncbi:hypothetical protein MXD61_10215 [Frankia sp. AgPm24]|uniref:hypothetical protein n=1 Tax=Frankia sp. AgPm24 TaxID=631128 RepID=UPI00200F1BCE|nr:hypothetical protein [Frankia sp. AgPm24]MCK9922249.1 hypothetical protein [Frankia sp. AgPm24]